MRHNPRHLHKYVGLCLKSLRERYRWPPDSLAELLDIPVNRVQQYEKGAMLMSCEHIMLICTCFYTRPEEFLGLPFLKCAFPQHAFTKALQLLVQDVRSRQEREIRGIGGR